MIFWLIFLLTRSFTLWYLPDWGHPDEWIQTLEPASLLHQGIAFHSQELGLHLRNLTWPMLLSLVLKGSDFCFGPSFVFRRLSIQCFLWVLDAIFLYCARLLLVAQFGRRHPCFQVAVLFIPWYGLLDASLPRIERLSEICLVATLASALKGRWFFAGLCASGLCFSRFPSAFLALGMGLLWLRTLSRQELFRLCTGGALGAFLMTLTDFLMYGRFQESLYMYSQYNLFSGASKLYFGEQGLEVYWHFFTDYWGKGDLLSFLLPVFLLFCLMGMHEASKKNRALFFGLVSYVLVHLLIGHKEARFLWPIEWPLRICAVQGFLYFYDKLHFRAPACLLLFLTLFGHMQSFTDWFQEVRDGPQTKALQLASECEAQLGKCCGLLLRQIPPSLAFTPQKSIGVVPGKDTIFWLHAHASCHEEGSFLSLIKLPGCTYLKKDIFRCALPWPDSDVGMIKETVYEAYVTQQDFGHIPSMPPIGTTPKELMRLGRSVVPWPPNSISWDLKPLVNEGRR